MTDKLYLYMPGGKDIPVHWYAEDWWSFNSGHEGSRVAPSARVYLNGNGTDHELRFIVWDNAARNKMVRFPCLKCCGEGWIDRPEYPRSSFLIALAGPDRPHDVPREDGKRSCPRCLRAGNLDAIYGASNSFCRAPGLRPLLRASRQAAGDAREVHLGERGLSEPSKADVLAVMAWCSDVMERIRKGDTALRWTDDEGCVLQPALGWKGTW